MVDSEGGIWGMAAAIGAFSGALLWLAAGYGFWPALLLGLLVAVLAGVLIRIFRDSAEAERLNPPAPVPPPPVPMAAGAPPPVAATAMPLPPEPRPVRAAAPRVARPRKAEAPDPRPSPRPAARPKAPPEPLPEGGDDLTRIRGIGTRIARALAAQGVTTFAQLAAWTEADIARIEAALKMPGRAAREDWVGQARRLAAAGEAEPPGAPEDPADG